MDAMGCHAGLSVDMAHPRASGAELNVFCLFMDRARVFKYTSVPAGGVFALGEHVDPALLKPLPIRVTPCVI